MIHHVWYRESDSTGSRQVNYLQDCEHQAILRSWIQQTSHQWTAWWWTVRTEITLSASTGLLNMHYIWSLMSIPCSWLTTEEEEHMRPSLNGIWETQHNRVSWIVKCGECYSSIPKLELQVWLTYITKHKMHSTTWCSKLHSGYLSRLISNYKENTGLEGDKVSWLESWSIEL